VARGSTLTGLQLAPQQPCLAWGGPLPPFSWLLSGHEWSFLRRAAPAQRTQYAGPACTLLYSEARRWALGCWCIEARKPPRQETQVHTDTWASGHAADQNWTPSQSQKVKFEMEGMGRVLTGPETRHS